MAEEAVCRGCNGYKEPMDGVRGGEEGRYGGRERRGGRS
jgi:hypothetical protein